MKFEEIINEYNPSLLSEANLVDFLSGLAKISSAKNRDVKDLKEDQEVLILLDPKVNIKKLESDLDYKLLLQQVQLVTSNLVSGFTESDFDRNALSKPTINRKKNVFYNNKKYLDIVKTAIKFYNTFFTKFSSMGGENIINWDELSSGKLKSRRSNRALNVSFLDYLESPVNINEVKQQVNDMVKFFKGKGKDITKYILGIDPTITRKKAELYNKEGFFKTAGKTAKNWAGSALSSGYDTLTSDIGLMGTRYG